MSKFESSKIITVALIEITFGSPDLNSYYV